jgi:hypothetical protein
MIRAPLLDDIDFEALFEEARALIPRFAPDWTDHNLHDPGITLIDLIAWIADAQIYRIGFVGDRHLAAFAALLGIAPQHAAPARGLLWPARAVAPGTVDAASAVAALEAPDLQFRLALDGPIQIGNARLVAIAVEAPGGGETAIPLEERIPLTGGARLRLGFDGPLAPPAGGRITLGVALDGDRTVAPEPRPAIEVEQRADDGSGWQFVSVADDGTAGLSRTGIMAIDIPAGPSAGREELRLRLPDYLPAPAAIERLALGVLPVEQTETADWRVLGTGNGFPDQYAALDLQGLLGDAASGQALDIVTDEEGGRAWIEVEDLAAAGPDDLHFVRDARAGGIRFGNGVNGRAPPRQAQIAVRGLVRTRGAAGNLGQGRNWRVTTSSGILDAINRSPLSGGRDAETIDERIERMRLRALDRSAMITDADMRAAALALRPLGIGQAEVLPGVWPPLPGRPVCAARTLVVRTLAGRPTADHVDAVAAALAPRRALGERLAVVAPNPVPIAVTATVLAGPGAPADIAARIEAALAERLSDRADDGSGRGYWPAGRPVTAGEIEALIAETNEVRSIAVAVAGPGEAPGPGPVTLGPTDAAVLDRARLSISVVGGTA